MKSKIICCQAFKDVLPHFLCCFHVLFHLVLHCYDNFHKPYATLHIPLLDGFGPLLSLFKFVLELKKVLDDQGRPQEVPLVTAARPFPSQLTFTGWPAHWAHFAGTLFKYVCEDGSLCGDLQGQGFRSISTQRLRRV